MAELNPNAKKWVEALRSGRFQQGTRALTMIAADGKEFDCCLGVACKVAIENGLKIKVSKSTRTSAGNTDMCALILYGELQRYGVLPLEVREWLGLNQSDGMYMADGIERYLTHENDVGATFAEIADIVESQPEGLFAKVDAKDAAEEVK